MEILKQAKRLKQASYAIMNANTKQKNNLLKEIYEQLDQHRKAILEANACDVRAAQEKNMPENRIDRMMLNEQRIDGILEGIQQVIALKDPIGERIKHPSLYNGCTLSQLRVPLGVVGIIYEARPNVSVDACVLCLKSGNAVFLRGSKDILATNRILVNIMKQALMRQGFNEDLIMLVEDTTHESARAFMRLHGYLDVLIPRGGAKLIQECVEHANVPLIETGNGNCHVYVDANADFEKALPIILNAKTQRTSVCNACESVLLHRDIVSAFAPRLIKELKKHHVLLHGDKKICSFDAQIVKANEEDYAKEYLALEISIKCVDSLEDAICHINQCSTHHSECIVSENKFAINKFLKEVDSACVYANASTRFSDGFEFGLGAEIGISTQKLHARGPMGLQALTTLKYIVEGNGQIRS